MFALLFAETIANTKLTLKPEFQPAAFNRTKAYATLVEKGFALQGKQTSISGYARTCSYVDASKKQVPCSMYVIESGILLTDPCIIFYKIDDRGEAECILGPVTTSKAALGGGSYGHVLQPRLFFENNKFYAHVFYVCPGYITFSRIDEKGWTWSTVNNGGMLHPQGNQVMEFEEDYQIHAFIPKEGGEGFYIFRQPLVCIPNNEEYFSCLPLLAFDVATKTFSQVMIPHMFPGRHNKLQDPYYSITIDQKHKRVILVSKKFYKAEVNNEYAYQMIPFSHPIWRNSLDKSSSYLSDYKVVGVLDYPNNVTYERKTVEDTTYRSALEESRKTLDQTVLYSRYVFFGLEASLSTFNMRTTSLGLPYYKDNETYVSIPYNIPNNWGVNGHYDSEDIPSWKSTSFGIRMIKIENTKQELEYIVDDKIALYLDLTAISTDNSYLSIFAAHQSVQFCNPPIIDDDGKFHFVSLPVQVVYNCKQNFYSYHITYDPKKVNATETDDALPTGSPFKEENLPLSQQLYVFDAEAPKAGKVPSMQTFDLIEKYEAVYNKFGQKIALFTGYNLDDPSMYNERERYIDYLVRIDANKADFDIRVKLTFLPLPNNQVTVYHDTLYNKLDGQTGEAKTKSSMEIINPDDDVISPFNFTINPNNHPQYARIFKRNFVLRNVDLFFHLQSVVGYGNKFSIYTDNLTMINSRLSIRNNLIYDLHIYNNAEIDSASIDPRINFTIGSAKTSPYFRYYHNDKGYHLRTTNPLYVTLGYQFAGASISDPNRNTEKFGINGIKENIFIYNAVQQTNDISDVPFYGYNTILRYRSNTGETNGRLFPNVTLKYDNKYATPINLQGDEEFPYKNGETIYIDSIPSNKFQINISKYIPIVARVPVIVPLHSVPFLITLNECPEVLLTYHRSYDGNSRIIFHNDYIEVESLGRRTRVNKCSFRNDDSGNSYLHLSLADDCTKLPSEEVFNVTNNNYIKFILDNTWTRKVDGTIKLTNGQAQVFVNKTVYKDNITCFTAGKNIQFGDITSVNVNFTTVPDLLPADPVVCVTNEDGTRKCGATLEEVLSSKKEASVSVLESQTINANILSGKSVKLESTNNENTVTLNFEKQVESPSFVASNTKLSFKASSPVTIKSDSVALTKIPEITSTQPVTIEAKEVTIDAGLLETIDKWKGTIKNNIEAPKVTSESIVFDVKKNSGAKIDLSNSVAIKDGESSFGIANPGDREIRVKVSNDVNINYKFNIKDALALPVRVIEADSSSNIHFDGYVFGTQVESKHGWAKVFATEGTVLGTPGSLLECGIDTLPQMSDNREFNYRLNTALETNVTEVIIGSNKVTFKAGDKEVSSNIRNIVVYVTSPIVIKATPDAENMTLNYILGDGGHVTIDPSAQGKVEEKKEEDFNHESGSASNAGIIAGSVIGVVAFVAILGGLVYFFVFRKNKKVSNETQDDEQGDAQVDAEV